MFVAPKQPDAAAHATPLTPPKKPHAPHTPPLNLGAQCASAGPACGQEGDAYRATADWLPVPVSRVVTRLAARCSSSSDRLCLG